MEWRVAPAEESGIASHTVDVVTVAQALHWFDVPRFWREVERVVVPGGLAVTWTYGSSETGVDAIDEITRRFSRVTVGAHWPPERWHIDARYETLPFPFPRVATPAFELDTEWRLEQLLGYFRSWSATSGFMRATGDDPVPALARELEPLWGEVRTVRWPLTVIASRIGT